MTRVLGILNVTPDSFSDGGKYLEPAAAIAHAEALMEHADGLDIGAASSHPDSPVVGPLGELRRLAPVLDALRQTDMPFSIDTFEPEVQRWACAQGASWINDIHGFPHSETRRFLADHDVGLIAMFAVQQQGNATRVATESTSIVKRVTDFFDERIGELERDGVDRSRVVVDPGMGFFLGSGPEPSIAVLRAIPMLRERYGLPVLVSVSRKSFLRRLTGVSVDAMAPATLAAELAAVSQGVEWLRTHDPASLRMAMTVQRAILS
ncbi:MAG: dihydropteroate synthase type 2 [Myxococcota bacterium]